MQLCISLTAANSELVLDFVSSIKKLKIAIAKGRSWWQPSIGLDKVVVERSDRKEAKQFIYFMFGSCTSPPQFNCGGWLKPRYLKFTEKTSQIIKRGARGCFVLHLHRIRTFVGNTLQVRCGGHTKRRSCQN